MLSKQLQDTFIDIPKELEADLEEEILALYRNYSRDHVVPCIEEMTKVLGFFNTMLSFHQETGEIGTANVEKFSAFLSTYMQSDDYISTFFRLHKNVEYYFKVNGYFFERNWLFALTPIHYESNFINSPLVNVW